MATRTEQVILRGLNLVLRATFSPNNPEAQAKHFASLTQDIGPWFQDCAGELNSDLVPKKGDTDAQDTTN